MANAQKLSVDDVEFDILDQFELISFSEHACKEFICLALNNTIINVSSDLWTDKTPEVLKAEGYNGLSLNLNVFLNRPDLVDEANKLRLASTLCSVKNNEMKD
jgi:hypothetical protein